MINLSNQKKHWTQSFCGILHICHYLLLLSNLEFSYFKVQNFISDYKRTVKAIIRRNKVKAPKEKKISKDKLFQILKFWKKVIKDYYYKYKGWSMGLTTREASKWQHNF